MNACNSRWMSWAVTLVGVTALLVEIPQPMVGQTNPPQSPSQSAELEEANQLNEQVVQLYSQGKYSEAMLYSDQGNYTQAEPLYQRALAINEKVLSKEHPYVATILNSLALLYLAQGDITRAIEFLNLGNNIQEHNLALILTIGSEAQKRAYTATLSSTTDATVSLHIQTAPNNPQAARLALTTILQRKGRYLML